MAARAAERQRELAGAELPAGERDVLRSLSLGFLSMVPLLVAYEAAVAVLGPQSRNTAEILVGQVLLPLGDHARTVRWLLLALCALAAVVTTHRRGGRVRAGAARLGLEGAVGALLLGPLLVVSLVLLERWLPRLDVSWEPAAQVPRLAEAALVVGGAAWEELVFRVGAYSLLYLIARRFVQAFDGPALLSRAVAEGAGLLGSSLLFAFAHLEAFAQWLGAGGARFDPALFTWLALAGMLLGVIFRLRGPGVAAWTHGLFNLTLLLGIDPDVLS